MRRIGRRALLAPVLTLGSGGLLGLRPRRAAAELPPETTRIRLVGRKAADVCARDPARAAQFLVDNGYASRYDYALQTMKEDMPALSGGIMTPKTRSASTPSDCERSDIKSTPQKIIAQGTDWRFFNELKKELKG